VKLLRFLQERELRPLGARKATRVDVRLIAASNRNLEEAVRAGQFRRDLYYRLNVIGLVLPPLRERREDIPLLARHFVARQTSALGGKAKELTHSALQKLMLYDWPGNVRELENVLERAVVLSRHAVLRADDVDLPSGVEIREGESFQDLKARIIREFERGYVQELLRQHKGNITRAAQAAGKHRRAFWEVMRKHHIRISVSS
jgi:DNA-binding NtrC family response regulator